MPAADNKSDPRELQKHILGTYLDLRKGIAAIGAVFPLLLFLIAWLTTDKWLRPSVSDYFYAGHYCRTVFIGVLFAIGVFLYLYKGHSTRENVLLNIAGFCAPLIGVFPASPPCGAPALEGVPAWFAEWSPELHGAFAVSFFLAIVVVAWTCADDSLRWLPEGACTSYFRKAYRAIGTAMGLSMVGAVAFTYLVGRSDYKILFVETAGIWSFAAYWLFKTNELGWSAEHSTEKKVTEQAVEREVSEK